MNRTPVETCFAPLIAAAAATAARRELSIVRAAVASVEVNALAQAFYSHRAYLACLMGWLDARIDFYCMTRLHQLAAAGIPADDLVFVQAATQLIQHHHEGEVQ